MTGPLDVPTGDTSDGYHTFNELYAFRKAYNAALFNEWAAQGKYDVHKAWRHSDGELCFGGGWFVVVVETPAGQVTNHYEFADWPLFQVPERECGNEWDGHTAQDALRRLLAIAGLPVAREAEALGSVSTVNDGEKQITDPRSVVEGTPPAQEKPKVYVASRASVPERPAMWQRLRAEGWNIVSTWIDEAEPGATADWLELWARIEREIRSADGLVLYVEAEDFPLKGALVEVGMALGMGKPVCVVLGSGLQLEPGSMRPLGSWAQHPLVEFKALDGARDWIRWGRANRHAYDSQPATLEGKQTLIEKVIDAEAAKWRESDWAVRYALALVRRDLLAALAVCAPQGQRAEKELETRGDGLS